MRKSSLFVLFLALLMSFLFLNSCDNLATTLPMTKDEYPISDSAPESTGEGRVVSVSENGELLLALDSGEVSRLTPSGSGSWAPGMKVILFSNGTLEEEPNSFDDLCALYLQVLEDLWETDPGLNENLTYLGMDLTKTSLSESEQAAVSEEFAVRHNAKLIAGTYSELVNAGYIDGENLVWEDGCLFTITETEKTETKVSPINGGAGLPPTSSPTVKPPAPTAHGRAIPWVLKPFPERTLFHERTPHPPG